MKTAVFSGPMTGRASADVTVMGRVFISAHRSPFNWTTRLEIGGTGQDPTDPGDCGVPARFFDSNTNSTGENDRIGVHGIARIALNSSMTWI